MRSGGVATARQAGAAIGLLALVLALSVGFILGAGGFVPFLPNAIANRVMEATPLALATLLLSVLGPVAKPFALAGGLALLAGLAGIAGALVGGAFSASAGPRAALPIEAGAALLQGVLAYLLSEPRSIESAALVYGLWLVGLWLLTARPARVENRRWFLRRSFQATAGLLALSSVATWRLLLKTLSGAGAGRPLFDFRPPAARDPAFAGVSGLTPEVSPIENFYLMSKTVEDPAVDEDTWELRIDGLVQTPLRLTYEDLLSLPRVDQWMTLRCVSNPVGGPLINNALWSGVPIPELLRRTTPRANATTFVMEARDTFSDGVPLSAAMLDTALLAYAVNGNLLNRDHGFPARVLIPGLYGFKNVKWVQRLRLIAGEFDGPWQRLGWTKTAVQTTFSRIDFVRPTPIGAIAGGLAFAGDRGISAVEVSVNGGVFSPAKLHVPPLGPLAWTQWIAEFPATGTATVTVRATDGRGALQEETRRDIYPDGATGWHSITVEL